MSPEAEGALVPAPIRQEDSWIVLSPTGPQRTSDHDLVDTLGAILTRLADTFDSGGHEPPEGQRWFRVGVSHLGGSDVVAPSGAP